MALLCVEPQADYDRIWPEADDLRGAQSRQLSEVLRICQPNDHFF